MKRNLYRILAFKASKKSKQWVPELSRRKKSHLAEQKIQNAKVRKLKNYQSQWAKLITEHFLCVFCDPANRQTGLR